MEAPPSDRAWLELQARLPQVALDAYVRAANAILMVLAVMVPVHVALLAFPGRTAPLRWWALVGPDVLWLTSGLLAFRVLWPSGYRFRPNNVDTIERAFRAMVARKRRWAIGSATLLFVGIVWAFVVWLALPRQHLG